MALLSNLLKEVGGKALSIGGILNYGLRKGIISPDSKIALWLLDLEKKQVSK